MPQFQLLSYLPLAEKAAPQPALCLWYEGTPKLYGLGVVPGRALNPFPFLAVFPEETHELWVFAEWVDTLRAMLEDGDGPEDIAAYLDGGEPRAFAIEEEGYAQELQPILQVLPRAEISLACVRNGLDFLLAERAYDRLGDAEAIAKPAGDMDADLVLRDASENVLALVRMKASASARTDWLVEVSMPPDGPVERFSVTDEDFASQFRAWLDRTKRPRPVS